MAAPSTDTTAMPPAVAHTGRLTIVHVVAPARVGGLEHVVTGLAAGHRERDHVVYVVAVLSPGEEEDHPFLNALRREDIGLNRVVVHPRAYLTERRRVHAVCRSLGPDIVHTHGYRADVVDGVVARRLGIPVVGTVHGFTRARGRGRLYEWMQRQAIRRFDAVVAVSRPQVGELRRAGVPSHAVHLIPNAWTGPMDFADRASARSRLGVWPNRARVGWVGRLSPEKGPDIFLDAIGRLRDLPVDASIVGDGRLRRALEARADGLGLRERVRWHGWVPGASRWLRAFDVLVSSSRTEGTPIVLFEAMAAGVPIVATRVGGVPDVVGPREAALVPAEDPEALAAAVRSVLVRPEAAIARARRARRRLATTFAREPWLARYEALYRSLRRQGP